MATYEIKFVHLGAARMPETVEADGVRDSGDWVEFYRAKGMVNETVLRLKISDVQRIERKD